MARCVPQDSFSFSFVCSSHLIAHQASAEGRKRREKKKERLLPMTDFLLVIIIIIILFISNRYFFFDHRTQTTNFSIHILVFR